MTGTFLDITIETTAEFVDLTVSTTRDSWVKISLENIFLTVLSGVLLAVAATDDGLPNKLMRNNGCLASNHKPKRTTMSAPASPDNTLTSIGLYLSILYIVVMKLIMQWLVFLAILVILIILSSVLRVQQAYSENIINSSDLATSSTVAIIFGAGLNPDGTPREMLEARVKKGIELLQNGQAGKLLFTGAKDYGHNEPDAMRDYALGNGVKPEQILIDYEGDTTFDSCYNAKNLFRLKNTILVTQKFHLPRALYLCNNLGLNSIGIPASSTDEKAESSYARREYVASIKAWIQINFPGLRKLF